MIKLREATISEAAAWLTDWTARLQSWYAQPDVSAEWAAQHVERRLATHRAAPRAATLALTSGQEWVGVLAVSAVDEAGGCVAVINDVWVAESHRHQGHAALALRHAEDWARDQDATSVVAVTNPAEPAHAALFGRYPLRGIQMIKKLPAAVLLPDGVSARPMTGTEFPAWRGHMERGYAADMAAAGVLSDAEAATESARQLDMLLPDGLATDGHTFLSLDAGGEPVATIWIGHRYAPGTSWVYNVEVQAGYRGRGYGRAAMLMGEQATLAAGDSHLGLNVFGQNSVAIRLYESMAYRAYDHHRSADL